jgi:hypothetical protein
MSESFFNYDRNIYCTKDRFNYKPLKTVTGKIHSGLFFHSKEAIAVNDETCSELIAQCQQKFGNDFQYIQSGHSWAPLTWDTVKASGVICQHLYADEHYYD